MSKECKFSFKLENSQTIKLNTMSLKRIYVKEEIYNESCKEIKKLRLDLQERDKKLDDKKKKYQRKEETLYELDVLNKVNESVSTDLEVYQQEKEEVISQQQEEEKIVYQEEVVYQEVEKETDDELDYDPDKEWLKYLED
ncbi:22431_t:CDS:2 [Racocetra persica]|uniref:22431_t:CDS:1 n=1 Tax=Racocetra persica TaxID=160502 RepID=A0ACA9RE63_9GLOM|nr:22431_t:CDS:2 [Racocetra persica]